VKGGEPLGIAIPRALGFEKVVVYQRVVPAQRAAELKPGDLAIVERMFGAGTPPNANALLDGVSPTPSVGKGWPLKPRPVPVPIPVPMVEVEPEVPITDEALGNTAIGGEEDEE
jgi:hypothetical protein